MYSILIMEAAGESGGFYRTVNRGASWEKMSSYASSGQYYNEIYCDPKDVAKVYSDTTKMENKLKFECEYDLNTMLKSAWEWEKNRTELTNKK